MNDKTALYLQSLKDSQGNFLWNQYDGTFMGKRNSNLKLYARH